MASIFDVLAYIGERVPHPNLMRALKLAYYAQAWHATWEGRPLYSERTEAWKNGPVCRAGWVAVKKGFDEPVYPLDPAEAAVVDAVIEFYGSMNGGELAALTHDEDPWLNAREGVPDGEPSDNEITVSAMRRYFSRKAIRGEAVPGRPQVFTQVSDDEMAKAAYNQRERWHSALQLLAER